MKANAYISLIIEYSGSQDGVIKCLPPLIIGHAELEEGLDILEQTLAEKDFLR